MASYDLLKINALKKVHSMLNIQIMASFLHSRNVGEESALYELLVICLRGLSCHVNLPPFCAHLQLQIL